MFIALKDHCSIVKDMATIPLEERDKCSPSYPFNQYDEKRISHLAKTFGESI